MYLIINMCVTAVKVSNFSGHYLRNRSTSDIGVLGYIGIVRPKEHSPEVWHIPPGTPCIFILVYTLILLPTLLHYYHYSTTKIFLPHSSNCLCFPFYSLRAFSLNGFIFPCTSNFKPPIFPQAIFPLH